MSRSAATLSDATPATSSGDELGADRLAALRPVSTSADAPATDLRAGTQRLLVATEFPFASLVNATSTNVIGERVHTHAIFAGHTTSAGVLVARSRLGKQRRARRVLPEDARPTAELVRDLWERSGLTWDQLARLFGVSRRSVHAWATGARLNAYHQELLTELTQLVAWIDTGDPHRNRDQLLAPRPGGPSLFDEVRARRADQSFDITGTLPPAQLLGALHDRGPGDNVG
jgi:DNA-binding transcriptional regulator YiaG